MTTPIDQVNSLEAELRDAMLAGDVKVLDALLAEDLIFTDQTVTRLTKADDLAAHRLGRLKITQIDISDQRVRPSATFAIVTLVADVGGSFDGHGFSARLEKPWPSNESIWMEDGESRRYTVQPSREQAGANRCVHFQCVAIFQKSEMQ